MTSVRRVVHAIALLVVVVLVAIFVVQAFPQAAGADHSFVVLSGSMEPTISPGDVVIVSSVPASSIEAKDIITYRRSTTAPPVTHRVLEVVDTGDGLEFVTKGDANEDADPTRVSERNLLGSVSYVIPYVGYVVQFANTRLGQIILVGGPLGLLAVTEAMSFIWGRDSDTDSENPSASEPDVAEGVAENPRSDDEFQVESGSPETEESTDAIALTTTDLRLSGLAFVLFSGYSIWIAFQHPGGLTIGVAMASVSAVLVIALVFVAGEPETPTPSQGQVTDGGIDPESPHEDTGGESS